MINFYHGYREFVFIEHISLFLSKVIKFKSVYNHKLLNTLRYFLVAELKIHME